MPLVSVYGDPTSIVWSIMSNVELILLIWGALVVILFLIMTITSKIRKRENAEPPLPSMGETLNEGKVVNAYWPYTFNGNFLVSRKKKNRTSLIAIIVTIVVIIIAVTSVVCYNNYQEPERDGMRFKKIYRADEYYLEEYVGSDSLVVIPREVNGIPVTGISEKAFYNHEKLRAVEIPESVTYIGREAFAGCNNLKAIEIPSSVTEIDAWAFKGCLGLEKIVFLDSWGEVGKDRALEKIGQGAFSNCSKIKNVTIPAQLKVLGEWAFSDCINLTNVSFEQKSQLKRIEQGAFSHCSVLERISIPFSVEYIGRSAFSGCERIEIIEVTPVEGWVIFYDETWVVSEPPSNVPISVLQDPAQTAYYLAGEFSEYDWERRE